MDRVGMRFLNFMLLAVEAAVAAAGADGRNRMELLLKSTFADFKSRIERITNG